MQIFFTVQALIMIEKLIFNSTVHLLCISPESEKSRENYRKLRKKNIFTWIGTILGSESQSASDSRASNKSAKTNIFL